MSARLGTALRGAHGSQRRQAAEDARGGARMSSTVTASSLAMVSAVGIRRPKDLQLAGELLASAAGAFHGHQHAGLDLGAGALEFGVSASIWTRCNSSQGHGHELGGLGLAGAGVDAEDAGFHIGAGEGIDGVDQAALFADFLEQAGGHAAAEQGREQQRRVVIRVGVADRGEAQDDVHLVEIALFAELAAGVEAGGRGFRHVAGQVGKMLAGPDRRRGRARDCRWRRRPRFPAA